MSKSDLANYFSKDLAVMVKFNNVLHINEDGRNWTLVEKQEKDRFSLAGITELIGYVNRFPGHYEKGNYLEITPFPNTFTNPRNIGNIRVCLDYVQDVELVVMSDVSRLLK